MTEAPLPDVLRPERAGGPPAESPDSPSFESYFRDPDFPPSQPLAWALGHRTELLDALRGLFHGPAAMVQLRLWCLMELCSQPQARLSREDIQQLFHAVWPEALETVLKRLRDLHLLAWDATTQDYQLPPRAQQVQGLLTRPPSFDAGEEPESVRQLGEELAAWLRATLQKHAGAGLQQQILEASRLGQTERVMALLRRKLETERKRTGY